MPKNYATTHLTCHSCQKNFYFHTHNPEQWKYYYKQGKVRPASDFYQLYCQPPFPNYDENIYLHCHHCLVFFHHTVQTDQEGQQRDGTIYIDKNGLCLECRNNERHIEHACVLNKQQRVWGTNQSWEGLFVASDLPQLVKVKQ